MFSIKDYLEKFKNITPPDGFVRDNVSRIVEENLGVKIPRENIRVQNNIVIIKESGSVKAGIFLKKKMILQELEKELGEDKTPKDIQ